MAVNSGTVAAADEATATQYNNARKDAITRVVYWPIHDKDTALVIVDGAGQTFDVPAWLDGWVISAVAAIVKTVSSSGLPSFQLYNLTDTVDILSTNITIDANETHSKDATTAAVIDAAHDDLAYGDVIRCDIDAIGTGTKGLTIQMTVIGY